MYAVVDCGSKQYRVAVGDKIQVDRLAVGVGETTTLDKVLLVGGDNVKVGTPVVAGASVVAKVLSHELGDKKMTFKYRRRRRSRVLHGYRASFTTLEITSING